MIIKIACLLIQWPFQINKINIYMVTQLTYYRSKNKKILGNSSMKAEANK